MIKVLFGLLFIALLIYAINGIVNPSLEGWIIIGLVGIVVFLLWLFNTTFHY